VSVTIKEETKKAFEWFINVVRGRKDVKSRVAVLANPDNLESMSILSGSQAEFVQDAEWLAEEEECYDPMAKYAVKMMRVSPSIGGKGREQTIQFVGALNEASMLKKMGITLRGEDKEK